MIKTVVVLVILAGGVVYDLREYRTPNWQALGGAGIGMGLSWWLPMGNVERVQEMPVRFLVRYVAISVVFFPLLYVRMIGAGDIKLMAVICGFLGPRDGSLSTAYESLTGAAMSLVKMLVQRTLFRRLNYFYAYVRRLILTKEVTVYHDPSRDGYMHTMSFGPCLFLGASVYLFFIKG